MCADERSGKERLLSSLVTKAVERPCVIPRQERAALPCMKRTEGTVFLCSSDVTLCQGSRMHPWASGLTSTSASWRLSTPSVISGRHYWTGWSSLLAAPSWADFSQLPRSEDLVGGMFLRRFLSWTEAETGRAGARSAWWRARRWTRSTISLKLAACRNTSTYNWASPQNQSVCRTWHLMPEGSVCKDSIK